MVKLGKIVYILVNYDRVAVKFQNAVFLDFISDHHMYHVCINTVLIDKNTNMSKCQLETWVEEKYIENN